MSWEKCRAVPSQQLPHVLCGAGAYRSCFALSSAVKGLWYTGIFPIHAYGPQRGEKLLSVAATAWVIWLELAWGTSQAVGWCKCAPCFKFVLTGGLFDSSFYCSSWAVVTIVFLRATAKKNWANSQFFCKRFAKRSFILEKIYNKKFSFLASECKLQINFWTDRSILKDVCRGKLE